MPCSGAYAGGSSGGSGEPPFFQINYIHSMFSMQILTAIQDTYLKFKFSLRFPQNIQKLRSI